MAAKRNEDKFLEKVVQNLANEYISRPKAIIILAVPMNQDAENSFAFRLIRDQKAEKRCVGVMTKADLVPKDDQATLSWVAMLKRDNPLLERKAQASQPAADMSEMNNTKACTSGYTYGETVRGRTTSFGG
ncbi:hypothetical protein B0H63DRAFT_456108 [Podospora didyma]|uniref:Dynamin-type G domain-containing protein n=1 Tax=Podospora didyma TaxID=330526 RepID=A0AAE0JYN8_9PEZI|nr:hypothetical protein B0H63DRAFT_456108 [Podospora didyma]